MVDEKQKSGEGDDQKDKLTDDPAFQEMQKAVQGIALLVQQGQKTAQTMQENFNTLVEKIGEPAKPKRDPVAEEDAVNELDNVGLMKLVVGEVGKVVDKKLGEVTETIGETNRNLSDSKLEVEVKELLPEHPDLLDWRAEMAVLANENPKLGIKRLHTLARSENPEKAEELDQKYTEESDEDKDKREAGFIGLMPTSGGFHDEEAGEKPLTKDEAAEKAWDETIEEFPGLGQAGEG